MVVRKVYVRKVTLRKVPDKVRLNKMGQIMSKSKRFASHRLTSIESSKLFQ